MALYYGLDSLYTPTAAALYGSPSWAGLYGLGYRSLAGYPYYSGLAGLSPYAAPYAAPYYAGAPWSSLYHPYASSRYLL